MKIFITGATGVVGARAVPMLTAAGHEVHAVVRSAEKGALVRATGAYPIEVDLFDPAALRSAVVGHAAVINLATHMPPLDLRAMLPGVATHVERQVSRRCRLGAQVSQRARGIPRRARRDQVKLGGGLTAGGKS